MLFIDKRYIRSADLVSFSIMVLCMMMSLFFVWSATYSFENHYSIFFKKQLAGVGTGICIYIICAYADYRTLMRWGYFAYFVVIGLLVFTTLKGSIGMGGQRWIDLLFFRVQPSELAKLCFPACVTYFLYTQKSGHRYTFSDFAPLLLLLLISCILIAKQPDLGTALTLFFSSLILFWFAGLSKNIFGIGLLTVCIGSPIMWYYLKEYQKKRLFVFLGYGTHNKERYQIEQSRIAIGSGGFYGKGFLRGTQNKLLFLPEGRTDFIYSVIAEEIGFVGTCFVLLLYLILALHSFYIIAHIKTPLIQLLALGLILHIIISAFINMAMVLNLLPVVGIPLPLISYGLSNMLVTCVSLGWFQGIAMRRRYIRD